MNTSVSTKVIKNKVGLLKLAQQLDSVSKACKVMGFSRDSFYRVNLRPQPPLSDAQKQYRGTAAKIAGAIAA